MVTIMTWRWYQLEVCLAARAERDAGGAHTRALHPTVSVVGHQCRPTAETELGGAQRDCLGKVDGDDGCEDAA
jgi:hypothetical protein